MPWLDSGLRRNQVPAGLQRLLHNISGSWLKHRGTGLTSCHQHSFDTYRQTDLISYWSLYSRNIKTYKTVIIIILNSESDTPEVSWSLLLSTANFSRLTSLAASGTEEQQILHESDLSLEEEEAGSLLSSLIPFTDWRDKDRCVTFGELLSSVQWFCHVGNTFLSRPQSVRHRANHTAKLWVTHQ